jgi:hypothetical protein
VRTIVIPCGEDYVGVMKPRTGCVTCSGVRPSRGRALAARMAAVLLATTLLSGVAAAAEPSDAAAPPTPVKAKWVTRKLHYIYQGFTAHYSCDGLQGEVTGILEKLGAGSDLKVRRIGCTRLEGPEAFPGVDATFSVLVPAEGAGQGAADSQLVMARWVNVTLQGSTSVRSDAPGCELIEEAKKRFLPLFTTRAVQFSSDCFPHSASISSSRLSADVLLPVKPAARPGGASPGTH